MNVSDKILKINNTIEQNKARYNLDRQIAKISVLSSRNVSKYKYESTTTNTVFMNTVMI